jgi:tetratricopeptide (TPR) repeat protein
MTSPIPEPSPQPTSPAATNRRRVWFVVVGIVLVMVGGAVSAWWFHRPAPAVPPMPQDIPDTEVRQAVERARKKVLDAPSDAYAWGYLGMILMAHDFLAEADQCFAEAARLNPKSPSWPYGRGLIAQKRDPDHVLPFLRQALATAGNAWPEYQSAARLQLAEALLERQQRDEAERLFDEEWRRTPDNRNPRAALGLGMIALGRGDEDAAAKFLTVARSNPSARKTATAQLAVLARNHDDSAAAAEFDRETVALPDDPPWPDPLRDEVARLQVGHYAWLRQESQLEDQHHFAEAAAVYLQESQAQPTARAYARAGFNLAQAGDFDQAEQYLRAAVQLDPNNAHAHFLFAITLFVRAEAEWKRSANSPLAREWFRESVEHARRTTDLRPSQAAAYLFWGKALKYLGEPSAAADPLRQGVECAPSDFSLQLALGEVLFEIGQYPEAEIHLENARKLNPNDRRPVEALERLRAGWWRRQFQHVK